MSIEAQGINGMDSMSISAEEYNELMKVKAELKQRRVEDKVKAIGSIKSGIFRQRIALRRIDIKKEAPDEDVVAYYAIHKLKNPTGDSTQKVMVTDNEIIAYKALDPDFNKAIITLAEVLDKVEELKALGKLTKAGDNPGNHEEETDL